MSSRFYDENRSAISNVSNLLNAGAGKEKSTAGSMLTGRGRTFASDLTNVRSSLVAAKGKESTVASTAAMQTARPMSTRVKVFDSAATNTHATTSSMNSVTSSSSAAAAAAAAASAAAAAAAQNVPATPSPYDVNSALAFVRPVVNRFPEISSPRMDQGVEEDPQYTTEYISEIIDNMRRKEILSQPPARYMDKQTDITDRMRAILVDWLVDVHYKFKFFPETLYLAINILDRFLAIKLVSRAKLQLVGVGAMLVASKYEEIYAPEIRDFVYISAKAYTKAEILKMERILLGTLKFSLTVPTVFTFLRRYLRAAHADSTQDFLAQYICEMSLQNYEMLKYLPSQITAASVLLTQKFMRREWTSSLQYYTQSTEEELLPCARDLLALVQSNSDSRLQAVFKKYSNPKFGSVAEIPMKMPITL